MTKEGALTLRAGDTVHSTVKKNRDGSPMRAKVTSVKHWVSSGDVEVRVKHGMYDYAVFRNEELEEIGIGDGR